jgi:cytochrome d ubiquinol oxidase subunit I
VLLAIVASLPLGYVAVELGWMVTELGRQPWILYHIMDVSQAFTTAPYVPQLFWTFVTIYTLVTATTIYVLLRYFHEHPLPEELAEAGQEDGSGKTTRRVPHLPARHVRTRSRRALTQRARKVEIHG